MPDMCSISTSAISAIPIGRRGHARRVCELVAGDRGRAASRRMAAVRSGGPDGGDRHLQSGGIDPPLRPSRRAPRSAGLHRSDRRSFAAAAVARADQRHARAAAGVDRRRYRPPRAPPTRSRPSSGCARSTARRPGTTTTTCSCPKSACGCGRRSNRASSGRRAIRSTRASCSIASRKSRCSSASCTARSRARRASRSKAST